jgi:hypothetical protein
MEEEYMRLMRLKAQLALLNKVYKATASSRHAYMHTVGAFSILGREGGKQPQGFGV